VLWQLEHALVSLAPGLARKDFSRMWGDRDRLPVEYLGIVAKLAVRDEQVQADAVAFLRAVADGGIIEAEFAAVRWMVAIVASLVEAPGGECACLIGTINDRINGAARNEKLKESHMRRLVCAIYLIGELFEHCQTLRDFDFTGLKLMISEELPNGVSIPARVRAAATVAIGKLCLWRRDISSSFVAAFASQLHLAGNAAVKCNCLVTLSDLCVRYSATVDPYVFDMSACFADEAPVVRRQALLIVTKLIAEDFLKPRPLIFFRFVFSLVDADPGVAHFAQSCLFEVLAAKDGRILIDNFVGALLYFNGLTDADELDETAGGRDAFRIADPGRRLAAYGLMISRMGSAVLFRLLQSVCTVILQDFVGGRRDVQGDEPLLKDALGVMLRIEEGMEDVGIGEASVTDDPRTEQIVNESRVLVAQIHTKLIQGVLPILKDMHKCLRASNSPLQSTLRAFFRKLCLKCPSLLADLARQEPILAEELAADLAMVQTPPPEEPRLETVARTPFRSPLLTRIAMTPQRPLVASAMDSPMSSLLQHSQDAGDAIDGSQKRAPIPFVLDEE